MELGGWFGEGAAGYPGGDQEWGAGIELCKTACGNAEALSMIEVFMVVF